MSQGNYKLMANMWCSMTWRHLWTISIRYSIRIGRDQGIDVIVHTAALIGSRVSRDPARGVEVNVGGSMAVIEAARRMQARRVVFCSSMAVYDFDRLPSGTCIMEDAAFGPKNLY